MRWNPYSNGLAAAAYVWGIGLLVFYLSSLRRDTPDGLAEPIAALSLLVFSAAVMGFLFFYRPALLLVEHKAAEAASFFLTTLAVFGVATFLAVLTIF